MDFEARVDKVVADAVAANSIAGAVTLIARDGEVIYRKAAGHFDREANTPMFLEAIFRLASVTKPIVAATALAMVDRGLLGLNNAVADHLPWFRPKMPDGSEPKITIRQLLNHTSGLAYGAVVPPVTAGLPNTDLNLEQNFTAYAEKIPLIFEPGTGWRYGPNTDILGAVIATLHASTLAAAVEQYVTKPLKMKDTAFRVTDTARLAVPYAGDPPGLRRMGDPENVIFPGDVLEVFSPGRIFNPKAFESGGAGMAGTADDLLVFFEMIRNRGVPVLKPETVAQAIQNQIGDIPQEAARIGQRFGFFGAIVVDPKAADRPMAPGTNRWGGAYGHDWFVDFASGITAIIMTNTAPEGGNGQYPRRIAKAIYGA